MNGDKREYEDIEQGKGSADNATQGAGPNDVEDTRNRKAEKKLDHGLKETFPASDPVSINPGSD